MAIREALPVKRLISATRAERNLNVTRKWLSLRSNAVANAIVAGAGLSAGYLATLGWHRLHAYAGWRVAVLAAWDCLIVIAGAWARRSVLVTSTVTAVLTALWSVDAATDTAGDGQGLWPVGAVMMLIGALAASSLLALLVGRVRRTAHH